MMLDPHPIFDANIYSFSSALHWILSQDELFEGLRKQHMDVSASSAYISEDFPSGSESPPKFYFIFINTFSERHLFKKQKQK